MDELTQEKLNQNMFVAGLNAQQPKKRGFNEFAREVLKIDASENDLKAIFQVPTKGEPLLKVIFRNMETRDKYFATRHELMIHKDIWLREDLTEPRQHLAWLVRKAVLSNSYARSWTKKGLYSSHREWELDPNVLNVLAI